VVAERLGYPPEKALTLGRFVAGSSARAKAGEVPRLDSEALQRTEIAKRLDIGVASVYRVLADAKKGVDRRQVAM